MINKLISRELEVTERVTRDFPAVAPEFARLRLLA